MRSGRSHLHFRNLSRCTYSARISMLFMFLTGIVFQGCAIQRTYDPPPEPQTYSASNNSSHKHQTPEHQKPALKRVDKIPSHGEQHPSHRHQPPSQAKAHKVSKGRPFMKDTRPLSHGQKYKANKGEPLWGNEHPSSRGKSKEKQKDIFSGSIEEEEILEESFSPQEPAITASFTPVVFDNNQRSIIQSYYQNSGSKRSGKGKGKKSKRSKRNKTSSVARNDILTQPGKPLPRGLESQLPPPPPNTRRVLYNRQVLLIERGTNRVLDVINVNN